MSSPKSNEENHEESRDKQSLNLKNFPFFFSKPRLSQDLINKFWKAFFTDDFSEAMLLARRMRSEARIQEDKDLALTCISKVLLRQGNFTEAKTVISETKSYSGLRLFIDFLLTANPRAILREAREDIDSQIYKAQTIYLSKIYWGDTFLNSIECKENPDDIIEKVFNQLIEAKEFDRAILASIQSLELIIEDQLLSEDLYYNIIQEHINNLLELSKLTKYDSTKAKLFLIKAKIFKDAEAASDAEILFGKDQNHNGLGEIYLVRAREFQELPFYEKALKKFESTNNILAQGFVYESLASLALVNGEIKQATQLFERAKERLNTGGVFEKFGLEIQRISLMAIQGKYQKVKELVHSLIKPNVPIFFIGQAYQILANTIIQLGEDSEIAKGYIESASDIFRQLKRYNQLLYTLNVYFQLLVLEDDIEHINKVAQEVIQLANKLGNEEVKAAKYLDLAFVTLRISIDSGNINDIKLEEVTDYFKKAIHLYQEQDNAIGEADTYQAMGNMFTGLGKLEDALSAFLTAKKLYQGNKALLQAAITDTLIGILLLNYVVLNEQTYPMAARHLEQALLYFSQENLLDLMWKTLFYLADLNHKYYMVLQGNDSAEVYKNKASSYYLEMLTTIQDYEEEAPHLVPQNPLVGVTLDDAHNKAQQFFMLIGEEENAKKFRRFNQGNN